MKIERTSVATALCAAFGTWVSRLLMKWVRQRCQLEPGSVAAMASWSPLWASEVTLTTPVSPRLTRLRRNASQPAPSSVVTTSTPRISRRPSSLAPTATTTATLTIRPPSRDLTTRASSQRKG